MGWIFHIITKEDWAKANSEGQYSPESLAVEGFIHMSKADQLTYVANNLYKGKEGLKLLKVWEEDIKEKIIHEPPKEAPQSGFMFPHIYGPLNLDAIKKVLEFEPEEDGSFKLPPNLLHDD